MDTSWLQSIIPFLSFLTLLGNIILVLYVLDLGYHKMKKKYFARPLWNMLKENALSFVVIVTFLATAGSLSFSELLDFEPCKLCWFQRIFMYPQLFMGVFALLKKEKRALVYLLVLSIPGALIAAYHYYGQMIDTSALPCSAVGLTASCSTKFFTQFGYITIPFMALTAFLLIIMSYHLNQKYNPHPLISQSI